MTYTDIYDGFEPEKNIAIELRLVMDEKKNVADTDYCVGNTPAVSDPKMIYTPVGNIIAKFPAPDMSSVDRLVKIIQEARVTRTSRKKPSSVDSLINSTLLQKLMTELSKELKKVKAAGQNPSQVEISWQGNSNADSYVVNVFRVNEGLVYSCETTGCSQLLDLNKCGSSFCVNVYPKNAWGAVIQA